MSLTRWKQSGNIMASAPASGLCARFSLQLASFFNHSRRQQQCRRPAMLDKNNKLLAANADEGSLELTEELIRVRAYHIYEERGCEHGHHLEDWLQAEAEITGPKIRCATSGPEATEGRVKAAVA